jgi:hypothetical protein
MRLKGKIKLIEDYTFPLPFKLPMFRTISGFGNDTFVYIDFYKGEPIYVGIGDSGRISKADRNKSHRSVIESLGKDEFIERKLIAELSYEDAEYLESSLIRFYGRKDSGEGSLLNWTDGIEKSPLERLEDNGATPWELFELHFWGYPRILAV